MRARRRAKCMADEVVYPDAFWRWPAARPRDWPGARRACRAPSKAARCGLVTGHTGFKGPGSTGLRCAATIGAEDPPV